MNECEEFEGEGLPFEWKGRFNVNRGGFRTFFRMVIKELKFKKLIKIKLNILTSQKKKYIYIYMKFYNKIF